MESRVAARRVNISYDFIKEITTPHIALPDVHVIASPSKRRTIRMYYHGLKNVGHQVTRVAEPTDGITNFEKGPLLFNADMRHTALLLRDKILFVFWTQVGDTPERILSEQNRCERRLDELAGYRWRRCNATETSLGRRPRPVDSLGPPHSLRACESAT